MRLMQAATTVVSAAPAPAASTPGLPPGWFKATDPTYNHPYYYNPSTGERLWEPPRGSGTPSAAAAAAPAQVGPGFKVSRSQVQGGVLGRLLVL